MGITPIRGVQATDVVAAEESDDVVDHQHLAVVTASVTWEAKTRRDQRMPAYRDVLRQGDEGPRHDEIGEFVEDYVDLDAAIGGIDQRVLERLTNGVALPDEGLEEDPRLGLTDGVQHVAIEVLTVGVDGDLGAAHRDRAGRKSREGRRLAELLSPIVDHHQGE